MVRNHRLNKYLSILVMTVLFAVVRQVYAEDCPCSPCPGGVYGCEDGCISICYLETNQCYASCTKGKSLAIMPSLKLDMEKRLRRVHINNVPSGSVKPILEQLFNIELLAKSEAKTELIKIKADNVDLNGILEALEEQGLVLKLQQKGKYLLPEKVQQMLQDADASLSPDRKKIIDHNGNTIATEIEPSGTRQKQFRSAGSCPNGATPLCWTGCAKWERRCYEGPIQDICVKHCVQWKWKCICPKEPW